MANEKFLNDSGLSHYDTKIKEYADMKSAQAQSNVQTYADLKLTAKQDTEFERSKCRRSVQSRQRTYWFEIRANRKNDPNEIASTAYKQCRNTSLQGHTYHEVPSSRANRCGTSQLDTSQ